MTKILQSLAGWRGYVLTAVVMLTVGLSAGFAGGWTLRDLKQGRTDAETAEKVVEQRDRTIQRDRDLTDVTGRHEQATVVAQAEIRTITQTIIKEVPVYVPAEADARFDLPAGLVRLHDAAATGSLAPLSQPASRGDDPPWGTEASDIPPSSLGTAFVENYGVCRLDQEKLAALQAWAREVLAVANAP